MIVVSRRLRNLLWAAGLLLWSGLLAAQGVSWDELSPEQREVLDSMSLQQSWAELDPRRQERLARGASRWTEMTPEQRQQAGRQFQR